MHERDIHYFDPLAWELWGSSEVSVRADHPILPPQEEFHSFRPCRGPRWACLIKAVPGSCVLCQDIASMWPTSPWGPCVGAHVSGPVCHQRVAPYLPVVCHAVFPSGEPSLRCVAPSTQCAFRLSAQVYFLPAFSILVPFP